MPSSNSETKLPKLTPITETQGNKIARQDENTTVALQSYHSGDFDQMVKSMMEEGQNKRANGRDEQCQDHIESSFLATFTKKLSGLEML